MDIIHTRTKAKHITIIKHNYLLTEKRQLMIRKDISFMVELNHFLLPLVINEDIILAYGHRGRLGIFSRTIANLSKLISFFTIHRECKNLLASLIQDKNSIVNYLHFVYSSYYKIIRCFQIDIK